MIAKFVQPPGYGVKKSRRQTLEYIGGPNSGMSRNHVRRQAIYIVNFFFLCILKFIRCSLKLIFCKLSVRNYTDVSKERSINEISEEIQKNLNLPDTISNVLHWLQKARCFYFI